MTTRILVVDDHPDFRAAAAALLSRAGFEVVGQAGTGAEVPASRVR